MSTASSLLGEEYADLSDSEDESQGDDQQRQHEIDESFSVPRTMHAQSNALMTPSIEIDMELESAFGRLAKLLQGSFPGASSSGAGRPHSAYPLKRIHVQGLDDDSMDSSVDETSSPVGSRSRNAHARRDDHRQSAHHRPGSAANRDQQSKSAHLSRGISPKSPQSSGSQSPTLSARSGDAPGSAPRQKRLKESDWDGLVSRLTGPKSSSKIDRLREKLLEEEVREVRSTPELCPKSREMAAKIAPFMARLDLVKQATAEKKERLKQSQEEKERQLMQPDRTHTSPEKRPAGTLGSAAKGFDRRLELFEKWKELRQSKIEQSRQKEVEDELKECSFQPKISDRSKKLIESRFRGSRLEERVPLYNEIREKKFQQLVSSVESERYAVRSPQINPRSRKLASAASAHDRLYRHAQSQQRRKEERQVQLFDEYYRGQQLFQPHLLHSSDGAVTAMDDETGVIYEFVPVDLDSPVGSADNSLEHADDTQTAANDAAESEDPFEGEVAANQDSNGAALVSLPPEQSREVVRESSSTGRDHGSAVETDTAGDDFVVPDSPTNVSAAPPSAAPEFDSPIPA
eukprot:ANDGO_03798.mRNA.1 hypothetical protein